MRTYTLKVRVDGGDYEDELTANDWSSIEDDLVYCVNNAGLNSICVEIESDETCGRDCCGDGCCCFCSETEEEDTYPAVESVEVISTGTDSVVIGATTVDVGERKLTPVAHP